MARRHWLIKSEPQTYSFERLERDGWTTWDGVRNFEARNNLRAMRERDLCLFYPSNEGRAVVGVAQVGREAYADPTDGDWSAVDIRPVRAFARPVTLDELRAEPTLARMMIFRRPRLSVGPITPEEFERVALLGKNRKGKKE